MQLLNPNRPGSVDAELVAIKRVVKSLGLLSQEARLRVLQYSLAHLGIDSETIHQVFIPSVPADKIVKAKTEEPGLKVPLYH